MRETHNSEIHFTSPSRSHPQNPFAYFAEMIIGLPHIAHIHVYDQKKEQLSLLNNKHIQFLTDNFKDLSYANA